MSKKNNWVWIGLMVLLVITVHSVSSNHDSGSNTVAAASESANSATAELSADNKIHSSGSRIDKDKYTKDETAKKDNEEKDLSNENVIISDKNSDTILADSIEAADKAEKVTTTSSNNNSSVRHYTSTAGSSKAHTKSKANSIAKTLAQNVDHQALANVVVATENNLVNYKIAKKQILATTGIKVADSVIKSNQEVKKEIGKEATKEIIGEVDKLNQNLKDLSNKIPDASNPDNMPGKDDISNIIDKIDQTTKPDQGEKPDNDDDSNTDNSDNQEPATE